MGTLIDLTGKRFGRLTAIRYGGMVGHNSFWRCVCDCGQEIDVSSYKLRTGHTQSCGCLHGEMLAKRNMKHGLTSDRLYSVYASMKNRCYNKSNSEYHCYGGRGIKVCDEWLDDFQSFYTWALESGYKTDAPRGEYTLDRIDNDSDYSPSNCRWISICQQNRRRKEVEVTDASGVIRRYWSIRSAETSLGIDRHTIRKTAETGNAINGMSFRICKTLKLDGEQANYVSGWVVS